MDFPCQPKALVCAILTRLQTKRRRKLISMRRKPERTSQGSYAWFLWRRACSIGYAASFCGGDGPVNSGQAPGNAPQLLHAARTGNCPATADSRPASLLGLTPETARRGKHGNNNLARAGGR